MLKTPADLAIVVGGYNSSNTSHLVELCEQQLPSYFISSEEKLLSAEEIIHYDLHLQRETTQKNYLTGNDPLKILLTSGASCPDAIVENVIRRLAGFFKGGAGIEEVLKPFVD
jgi:4-hydroxy-3-methylbut-2-enyl diphosphate reductase